MTYSLVKREDGALRIKWFPVSLYLCSSILNIILAVVLDTKSWHPFIRLYCRLHNVAEVPQQLARLHALLWVQPWQSAGAVELLLLPLAGQWSWPRADASA